MTLIWGRGSKGPLRKWRGGKEDHFADPAEALGRLMRYATLYCSWLPRMLRTVRGASPNRKVDK
jgi:hypothetical protein